MLDDRLLHAFGTFGAPAEPDAVFADRLFEELASDLGLRQAARPAGSLGSRLLRALGMERLPVGRQALRLAYLTAMLGLLVGLLVAAALIASQLHQRPSPLELVRLSQGAYDDPPSLRLTIHAQFMDAVLTSDGNGTWRSEVSGEWGDAPGTFSLYDGTRVGWFDPTTRVWSVVPVEEGGPPYPLNDAFTWTQVDFPAERAMLSAVSCADATELGESTVAGRPVDGLACPGAGMQYWIDRETHLVLRSVADEQSRYWAGVPDQDWVIEVTAFEEIKSASPADFAWSGPPGANPPDSPLASSTLQIGRPPPAWEGRTMDGHVIKSDGLKTPAAILFFEPSCSRCPEAFDDFAQVAPGVDGLNPLLVGYEDPPGSGAVDGFVRQHPTDIPVVMDEGSIYTAWGITGWPALVLLGADGTVSGMLRTRITREDLGRILAAVAGGTPIPSVAPVPSPTPTPGDPSLDPSVVCFEDLVTCLPVGSQMPQWSAELLQGGSIGSADLAGKPAVLLFMGVRCDGPCQDGFLDELADLGALADTYRDRATVMMISDGENQAGDTQAAFEAAGIDIPVVFDLDASLSERFAMIVGGALVFDADGRYVDHVPFPGVSAAGPILDDLLGGAGPSGSP